MFVSTVPPLNIQEPISAINSADSRLIDTLDKALKEHFEEAFEVQPLLNRQLVSFQANKSRPVYRWYKYKEAFSASLIEYFIERYQIRSGKILDPFAGSGTALFVASELGLESDGIELLPIGQEIINTRQIVEDSVGSLELEIINRWIREKPWLDSKDRIALNELRITKGAYPYITQELIERYIGEIKKEDLPAQVLLRFALLCVLESISYTRKDGQYLRWDHRSIRKQGQKIFDKGKILDFDHAITSKLHEIIDDLKQENLQEHLFTNSRSQRSKIQLFKDSSLNLLPQLASNTYDAVITSPPYCNRYDYTRTYALELALLGIDEPSLADLRQTMLSCTVENRAKDLLHVNPNWARVISIVDKQELLQAILRYLTSQRDAGLLNNAGIPRMVRGYFYEMACIIFETYRLLKPGGHVMMVNDNVRYAGVSISVDLILSKIAEDIGFAIDKILVLPSGKGNSSQQMGTHGREQLRKCVYIWKKCKK